MHPILVLLRKDFTLFVKNKGALSLTFLIPFLLIYLFGQIFGVNRSDRGPSGIPLAVVNESTNPAATRLIDQLKKEKAFRVLTQYVNPDKTSRPLTEADLKPMMKANEFRFALVIPADLIASNRIALHLKFLTNPLNEIETQTVTGLLQKTIFSNVPQLLGQALQNRARSYLGTDRSDRFDLRLADVIVDTYGGERDQVLQDIKSGNFGLDRLTSSTSSPSGDGSRDGVFSRIIKIDTEQVTGKDVKSPAATGIVGGWAMQFLLFALSASAASLFYESEHGLFQRVLAAPVTRSHILWSKFLYGVCLGLIQLITLFFAGRLLFGIDVEHHLGPLILVCVFAAAACTSFGMLLAAISSSADTVRSLATLLILLMSAIGGAWVPISFMPEFIQKLSKLTLVYWSMQGFNQVLWMHSSLAELLPTLGILAAIAAAVMTFANWRFNHSRLFD